MMALFEILALEGYTEYRDIIVERCGEVSHRTPHTQEDGSKARILEIPGTCCAVKPSL